MDAQLFKILPSGRKRYLNVTAVDIIVSLLLPFWGIVIGFLAVIFKGEKKRGMIMMLIAYAVMFVVVFLSSVGR